MDFIAARWFTPTNGRRIDYIVIHDMEAPENTTTAEAVAHYFAGGSVKASAHYCVDSDSVVQCVRVQDIAWHAPPNQHSIGVEHAGYARQTRAEWLDPYGKAMLGLSAKLVAELCAKFDLPVVFLSPADLKAGKKGITTHANVSAAFGESTHTDPGPRFPIDIYMDMVKAASTQVEPVKLPAKTTKTVVVSKGQTLAGIAAAAGITLAALLGANHFQNPDLIQPGTRVTIPAVTVTVTPKATPKPTPKPVVKPPTPKPAVLAYPGIGVFRYGRCDYRITALGRALVARHYGHYRVGPGPCWGSADQASVAAFQRAQGWGGASADGYPGPETWRRLAPRK